MFEEKKEMISYGSTGVCCTYSSSSSKGAVMVGKSLSYWTPTCMLKSEGYKGKKGNKLEKLVFA